MTDDSNNGPRVVDLPVQNPTKALSEEIRRNLPTLIANADIIAKIRRANYEALVREGFTEAQAMDLCWR